MTRKAILLLGLGCFAVTGCSTPNTTNSTVAGTLIGGTIGTGVGLLTHRPAAGMLIGGGTGALVGNAVGQNQDYKEKKAAEKAAQDYAAAHPPLSLVTVVDMANKGIPDSVIIQQMASTNSYYALTPADIQYLQTANVSTNVILAMQQRTAPPPVIVRPTPVVVYQPYAPPPPPPPVGVGVIISR